VRPIIGGVWPVTEWHTAFEKMHKGEVVKSVLKPRLTMRLKDKVILVTGSTDRHRQGHRETRAWPRAPRVRHPRHRPTGEARTLARSASGPSGRVHLDDLTVPRRRAARIVAAAVAAFGRRRRRERRARWCQAAASARRRGNSSTA
jgi:hypothetical protein